MQTCDPNVPALRRGGPTFGPQQRTCGPHLRQLCARRQRPTDQPTNAPTGQHWAKVGQRRDIRRIAAHLWPTPRPAMRTRRSDRPTDRRTDRPHLCAALRQISAFAAQRCTDQPTESAATDRRPGWRASAAIVNFRPCTISPSDESLRPTHQMYQLASIDQAARPCGIGTSGEQNRRRPRGEPSQS